jgi:hypothetical protein
MERELVPNLIPNGARDTQPTGLAQSLQAGRHVHAVPKDVIPLHNYIAEIDPNAQDEALVFGLPAASRAVLC